MLDSIASSDPIFSTIVPEKNQYRLYFSKNIIVLTLVGENAWYVSRQIVEDTFYCVSNIITTNNKSKFYYGDNQGYVYLADSGYLFNNNDIISKMRTPVLGIGNTQIKKRWRKLSIPIDLGSSTLLISVSYNDVDEFRTDDVNYSYTSNYVSDAGYWDVDEWDVMSWGTDASYVNSKMFNVFLSGTSPTLSFYLVCTNKGLSRSEFSTGFIHFSNRGRLR